MTQKLIAALAGAALFGGFALAPAVAVASPGLKGHSWSKAPSSWRMVGMRVEQQRIAFAWAEIQALRAFERLP